MTETTSKKNPFDFLFFYEFDGELEKDALLVGDDPSTASPLHLDICINKEEAIQKIVIRPIPGVTEASSSNYHLKLDFNAGILLQPEQITVEGDDWDLKGEEDDRSSSFYLLWKGEEVTLNDAAKPLKLTLNGVMGTLTSLVTTSRTTVTLSWEFKRRGITIIDVTPMTSAAPDDDFGPYYNNATETLKMIQREGKPNIPLYVGFFSSNRVLNTDSQHSTLKLRITNRSESCITFNYNTDATNRSQLIVALEVGDAKDFPWALGTEDQVNNVVVSIPQPPDKWEKSFGPEKKGSTLEWTFTPKSPDVQLGAQETVVVELSNIVTDHQTGTANLYLRYKYVPGYQDGEFICPIEKAPLVFPGENVGIGTTSPSKKFEVVGYDSSEQLVSVRGNNDVSLELRSTGSAEVYYELADGNNEKEKENDKKEKEKFSWKIGTNDDGLLHFGYGQVGGFNKPEKLTQEKMTILTDGNVGIGTTSPLGKLHVEGGDAIFQGGKVCIGTTDLLGKLHVKGGHAIFQGGNVGIGTTSPSEQLHVEGNAIFRGGNVGIGTTTTPTGKLHVVGTGTTFYTATNTGENQVTIKDGKVGIGTDSPLTQLHVVVASGNTSMTIQNPREGDSEHDADADIHYLSGTGNVKTWQAGANINGWYVYDGDYRLLVQNGGNVGIGTKAPEAKLHVNGGDAKISGNANIGGDATILGRTLSHSWVDIYNGMGVVFYNSSKSQYWKIRPEWSDSSDPDLDFDYNGKSAGWLDPRDGWRNQSDERLKEDIEPVSNVLDKLMKLQPSSYYWRNSNTKSQKSFGFVAQNVETVFPQFVKEKSGFKGLNYDNFTVIAIAAIQEQQQLIASMQEEINNLKTQLQQ